MNNLVGITEQVQELRNIRIMIIQVKVETASSFREVIAELNLL
jgi:hypothetical protein